MSGMPLGGAAVRVTSEALCSGSVRLKHSTAEELLGPDILREYSDERADDPKALLLRPYPAQRSSAPVHVQLRVVPTRAHQRPSLDALPSPPPSLHCELCGLGAWLRGQGAVPGVHWVQLWRNAGGTLRLRLCDGNPTALPRQDAAMQQQQVHTRGPAPNATTEDTVLPLRPASAAVVPAEPTSRTPCASDAAAAAAVATSAEAAAAMVAKSAVQAVTEAASPWQLHAPTCRAPCLTAQAAWHVPAKGCQLGAAGPDGMGSAAARCGPNGDHRGPLPTGQWSISAGRSPSLPPPPVSPPPLLTVPVPQLPPSLPSPPPPPPELPAQQAPLQAAQAGAPAAIGAYGAPEFQAVAGVELGAAAAAAVAAASMVVTVHITAVCGKHVGWLNTEVLELWPKACQLQFRQAVAVTLHLVQDQPTTSTRHTAARADVKVMLARRDATWFAIFGLGQANDVFNLWRDHAGAVWASRQRPGAWQGLQQQELEQQQEQQQQQEQGQQQQQEQDEEGAEPPRRAFSAGILTGSVGKYEIWLRAAEVQGLLVPSSSQGHSPPSMPDRITVHVEGGAGGSNSGQEGAQQWQQQGSEFAVRLRCIQMSGPYNRWYLSSVGALLQALGALRGDTVRLRYESDGRLVIWRAAQQVHRREKQLLAAGAVPPAACSAGSPLVGYKHGSQLDARVGAVRALWPEIASQLACGQSAEVEVHPAATCAGGQALGPFRLTLKLRTSDGTSPRCRLTGCGPLFRALGAQDRDALHMWKSPGDGQLMAGVQPRGGVHGDDEELQQGQEQEAEQRPPGQQGQQGDESLRQRQRKAWLGDVHRVGADYAVPEASGGEDGEAEEEWEGEEEGPPGLSCDGLSRLSKRARAVEGAAQQDGGPSATQQQHMQFTACPAGSILVGLKHCAQLRPLTTAVRALWPEVVSQWACRQSTEVEVHPAAADAGIGPLCPFRLTLKPRTSNGKLAAWRLTGCGPLFRALGAQERDAIHMWRSPKDGRVLARVQPRGGVREKGQGVQLEQLGAGTPEAAWTVRHVSEYDTHDPADE